MAGGPGPHHFAGKRVRCFAFHRQSGVARPALPNLFRRGEVPVGGADHGRVHGHGAGRADVLPVPQSEDGYRDAGGGKCFHVQRAWAGADRADGGGPGRRVQRPIFVDHKGKMETAPLAVVSVSMCSELGPVLTGLMVAGRVGAAIAAELGTMRVTEQIDALRTLATHPVDYLVVPRLLALHIALPLLTAESIAFGTAAGYIVCVYLLGIDPTYRSEEHTS